MCALILCIGVCVSAYSMCTNLKNHLKIFVSTLLFTTVSSPLIQMWTQIWSDFTFVFLSAFSQIRCLFFFQTAKGSSFCLMPIFSFCFYYLLSFSLCNSFTTHNHLSFVFHLSWHFSSPPPFLSLSLSSFFILSQRAEKTRSVVHGAQVFPA